MANIDKIPDNNFNNSDDTYRIGYTKSDNTPDLSDLGDLGELVFDSCDSCTMTPICKPYKDIQNIKNLGIQPVVLTCRFHTTGKVDET